MAIIIAISVALCLFTVLLCRRYVIKAFNSVDKILERILLKDYNMSSEAIEDSRLSKLTHKANRIIDMCVSEVSQSNIEKETVQGFISDMSHQMKTPLAGISMYLELLAEGNLSDEDMQDFISRMKNSTDKLQWMMDSLIKMSRLEAGAVVLSPTSSSIKQTISESTTGVLAEADKKNISIVVSDFTDVFLVHDKKWTIEALANILENAVKYGVADGEILVSVEPLQQYTKICITDYGIGISKEDYPLIFKRFYRGQNVKNKEGAGLGLYLATVIMEKQGGYIVVDSVIGQNTTFSLFLQNCKN
jgi:signal transduction histidine kinase